MVIRSSSEWLPPRRLRARGNGATDSIARHGGKGPGHEARGPAAIDPRRFTGGFFSGPAVNRLCCTGMMPPGRRSRWRAKVRPAGRDRTAEAAMKSLTSQLLVAMPQMMDPRFARSVVYVCAHSEEDGAMGLVVNKLLASLTMDELMTHLKLEPTR